MKPSVKQIWNWLEKINDPEIPVISIVALGVVRNVKWRDMCLLITITPTYSGCPATSFIGNEILAVMKKKGLKKVKIVRQLFPAWSTDWITKAGRIKLKDYGIAPPNAKGSPDECPQCRSKNVELVSQFGSTPCKALWRCLTCEEPFDYFKCL